MSFTIRPMTIDDFDEVTRLWKGAEGVGLDESDSRENISAYLVRNPNLSFVAAEAEAIIGAVLCGQDGRRGYLSHLAVASPHRRRGAGKALVDASLDGLSKQGILKCSIHLFEDNAQGRAFWLRIGWFQRSGLALMQKVT